jgi:hypothetical protein
MLIQYSYKYKQQYDIQNIKVKQVKSENDTQNTKPKQAKSENARKKKVF